MAIPNIVKKLGYVLLFFLLFPLVPMITGKIQDIAERMDPRTRVGVVPIKGVLLNSSTITKQLHTFFQDDTIKAILLKIESPGSASGTGQAIFLELENLKKEFPKPVISLVENTCASGAYYIASASDHIISTPSALIGSIGVTLSYFFQFKDFIEQFKIGYVPLHAGEYKNTTNPFTNITPAQQEMLQGVLDDTYDQFASDVARHRNVSLAQKSEWAEGRIFTGRQALKLGLIDELGSATQAIKAIKEKALIDTDIKWIHPPKPSAFAQFFGGSGDEEENSIFSALVHNACSTIEQRYNQCTLRT